jgi:hypothetical protein
MNECLIAEHGSGYPPPHLRPPSESFSFADARIEIFSNYLSKFERIRAGICERLLMGVT